MTSIKSKTNKPKTYIGIDHGSTNIGIALGRKDIVTPLAVISGKNERYAAQQIARMGTQNKVDKYVIGVALSTENKETHQSKQARKFGKLLKIISKKPVDYYEERYSSKEAQQIAIETGISPKRRVSNDDIAAGIIVKRYLADLKEK